MSNYNTAYGYRGISRILAAHYPRIHLLGIGGVGMYSLAKMAMRLGITVTGSDRERSARVRELAGAGIYITDKIDRANILSANAVVYSLAIDARDPELSFAAERGIPCISRADFLAYLSHSYKTRVGISGAHGKSTVTAMLSDILTAAEKFPTVASGAALRHGSPYLEGGTDGPFVFEACEYCDSFLSTEPTVSVVNNIELDHVDYFKDEGAITSSYLRFINKASSFAVISLDDVLTRRLIPNIRVPYVTVGSSLLANYSYSVDAITDTGTDFSLIFGDSVCKISLNVKGAYNVSNAAMAAAAALELGVTADTVTRALGEFISVERRLEERGFYRGRQIIYDYAHHPTEIAAAISAVKTWYTGEVTVLFKPHTYTRTAAFLDGFVSSLSLADFVLITDIYAAREEAIEGVSSEALAAAIGDKAKYVKDGDAIRALAATRGVVLVMGAGDHGALLRELNMD